MPSASEKTATLSSRPGLPSFANRSFANPSFVNIAVLIPVWQPTAEFPVLVAQLAQQRYGAILIVDDGSHSSSEPYFAEIASFPGIEILKHPVNLGKGRALKTGFHHLLQTHPELYGVVTADADGQHTPEDVAGVASTLLEADGHPVLGSRHLGQAMPWRNRLANLITSYMFACATGTKLIDTQTGLRGLPCRMLPELLNLGGDRYEYETAMLIHFCRTGHLPLEIPIATIYLDRNQSSHFRPLRDSLRIYAVLLRCLLARLVP